ncbi:MAG TPA: SMC-Scp complex subunit ScpB [Candidatus Paceibacterota bacterium]|nr:SMC-Scp complex subunit ScpB [Candidatus Paceibacterota bacterium]
MTLEASIEAVLFYKAEPIKKTTLAELFECTVEDIDTALVALNTSLTGRGISLTTTDTHAQLVTATDAGDIIESLRKADLKTDIGKAGAETLAIILYRGPISRIEIDKIRGVNSAFIIRNLLIRGLIERESHQTNVRSFTYKATPSLLNHLGVTHKEALPDFVSIMNTLDAFERDHDEQDAGEKNAFTTHSAQ